MMLSKMAVSILDVHFSDCYVVNWQFKITIVIEMSNDLYPNPNPEWPTSNQNALAR